MRFQHNGYKISVRNRIAVQRPGRSDVIETVGLTKRYADVAVVDDLSLRVEQGELLVLLGGSGSGKTTTLKMVNRLIEPSAGRIIIDGQDTSTIEAHELRRRIGYVFQQIGLFPHMTVAENVAVTLTLVGWDRARIRRRVDELLELVELAPALVRDRKSIGTVRRPAAAGWSGPCARSVAERHAARRAVRGPGPADARPAPAVVSADPQAAQSHRDLCDARHGRGVADGRSDRRHERRGGSSRSARRASCCSHLPTSTCAA